MDKYTTELTITITNLKNHSEERSFRHESTHPDDVTWSVLLEEFLTTLRGAGYVIGDNMFHEIADEKASDVFEAEHGDL